MKLKISSNLENNCRLFKRPIFVFLLLISCSLVHAQFVHPGITNKLSDLDRVKYMVEAKIDPWYTSYQEMVSDSKSSYNYTVRGNQSFIELGRDDGTNYDAWNSDIRAAYYNAIRWYVTGDSRHAEKSIEIFNAWNNLQNVTSRGTRALSGGIVYIMIEAAEIIKSTYNGWAASDIQDFKDMLVYPGYSTTVVPPSISRVSGSFYWQAYQGDSVRHGNQGLAGFRAVMAMGIFLDNEIMYDRALRYIQGLPHRSDDLPYPPGPPQATTISNVGDYEDTYNYTVGTSIPDFGYNEVMTNYIYENGQCQESSRDQQHTLFGIGNLCAMAEMAWNQGDDLYSHANDRLLLGLEYTTKYNVSYLRSYPDQTTHWIPTVASGEFTQRFNASQRVYSKSISPTHVGGFVEVRPIFEMPLAHYLGRGFKTEEEIKWTTRARDVSIEESGYEAAGHQNGAIGWGALTSRRPEGCYGEPISGFDLNGLPEYSIHALPGTIEAENFDHSTVSGQGRTYNDLTVSNSGGQYRTDEAIDIESLTGGGFNLTSIESGEWLTYTVNVPSNGTYDININYASANTNGTIKFSFNGTDITSDVAVPFGAPNSTGLTDWKNFNVISDVRLSKGVQSLKILFNGADDAFKLNNFTVLLVEADPEPFFLQAEDNDAMGLLIDEDPDDYIRTEPTSDIGGGEHQ
ncbi:alginate lyase family protein [Flavivirga aquimarina]|uniref:Alginate lyase family protein n=1 Tax=Flavivirga aquimarina TaxID=2027862 RepID=A0ABT8WF27_9FLAO|nr:carbohydrate-binding protein [Flavivirga aquimarina]MDO5971770.1 alginate lyase family protein [Flavivirga aquimarina]